MVEGGLERAIQPVVSLGVILSTKSVCRIAPTP